MKSNKLKIILDTNILLVSLSKTSKYHWIFEKLNNEAFDLFISNDVLSEYEEIIEEKTNNQIAQKTIRYLLTLPNVYLVNPYFNWILIENDPDDNKFVDCAVAGNVDYIITNDKHFDVLKTLDFPKIVTLTIDEFKTLFD